MIVAKKEELAQELTLALQHLQLKEQVLSARERNLELALVLSQSSKQTARISVRELHLWKRQAKALDRKAKHLAQIDRVLAAASQVSDDFVEIPRRDYLYMLLDQEVFSRRAFELMDQRTP